MELEERKELVDTGKSSGTWSVFWPLRSPKSLESGPRGDGVHLQAAFTLSRAINV